MDISTFRGLPYALTDTTLDRNQTRIKKELERFGATNRYFATHEKGQQSIWVIRFEYQDKTYRFEFVPVVLNDPDRSYKDRTYGEQAVRHMSARAYHQIKALLDAAYFDCNRALFGYLELPGATNNNGMPPRTSDLDVDGLTGVLDLPMMPALPGGSQ